MVILSAPPAPVFAALAIALTTLSACGEIKGAVDFVEGREAFEDRRSGLADRANTAYAAVPDAGSSTYRGEASLVVGTRTRGVVLLGDASVTVDFDAGEVTGSLTDFSGFDTNEDFSEYSGRLTLDDGVLGQTNPNDVTAQVTGTLRGDAFTVEVDGALDGHLKGTPIAGVLAATRDEDSTFELNGDEVNGDLVVAVTD